MNAEAICGSLDIDRRTLDAFIAGSGRGKLKKKLSAYEYKSFLVGYINLLDAIAKGNEERPVKMYAAYREVLFPKTGHTDKSARGGVIILPEVMCRAKENDREGELDGKYEEE